MARPRAQSLRFQAPAHVQSVLSNYRLLLISTMTISKMKSTISTTKLKKSKKLPANRAAPARRVHAKRVKAAKVASASVAVAAVVGRDATVMDGLKAKMQLPAKTRLRRNVLKAVPQSKHRKRKRMQKPSQKHVADVAAAEVATVRKQA